MLQRAIRRELANSQQAAERITAVDSFPKQWAYVTSLARFILLHCSRRAGKTRGTALRTAKLCSEIPGRRVLYINLTALNAQLQFFDRLKVILDKKRIPYRADNSDLLLYFGNGSFVRAMGCDNLGEVKTKLGDGWDEVIVDEMQSYADAVLYELIDRAIMPMLLDSNGSLVCQGTPPVTKAGFWYTLITKSTFAKFEWTLFDNPHIRGDALETYKARGIGPGHPVWEREICGRICVDPTLQVFCFDPEKNIWPAGKDGKRCVPEPDHREWRYSMGVDLGFSDKDAIVVLGWRMDDPLQRLWERWSWQDNHLDYVRLAEVYKGACERWQPQGICIDTGGHGARKIAESLKNVFSCYRYMLKPQSVADSVALMNDEFRTGRFLVDPDGPIAREAPLVVWKPDTKHEKAEDMSDAFHSDIMAAARYAHSCAYHFQANAPKEQSDEDRWWEDFERQKKIAEDPYSPYRS